MKFKSIFFIAIFILSICSSLIAIPQDMLLLNPELKSLYCEAESRALIQHLNLNDNQRKEIKKFLDESKKNILNEKEIIKKWQNEEMKTRLNKIIADLNQNKTPDSPDNNFLQKLNDKSIAQLKIKKEIHNSLEKIRNLLINEQKEKFENFNFNNFIGIENKNPNRSFFEKDAMEKIKNIRDLSNEEFDELINKIQSKKDKHDKQNKKDRIELLIDLTKQIRSMTEKEFNEKSETVQNELDKMIPKHPNKSVKSKDKNKHLIYLIFFENYFYNAL